MTVISRRRFVSGAIAATAAGVLGRQAPGADVPELIVTSRVIEVKGKAAKVMGISGPQGFRGLTVPGNSRFRVQLRNDLDEDTAIHWHGLTPPPEQDGVGMFGLKPLAAGETRLYDFPNVRSGTHWMHSHMGLQEQLLLAAPLILRESEEPLWDEQEHVIMLHDFSFRDPQEILAELRSGGGGHQMPGMAIDHSIMDHGAMAMPMAHSDIVYDAYLANDRTLDDPQIVRVEKGGQLRLRIINGCAASNMTVDLGSLAGDLIAVDGHSVFPARGSAFPLAIAQRADIRIKLPPGAGAWPVLFRPEGVGMRTGIMLASAGSRVERLAEAGEPGPPIDLSLERRLKPVGVLRPEPVAGTHIVDLTGGGDAYVWGFNGRPSMHDTLFTIRQGDRIEVAMRNFTAMSHPMHLHGHYFKIVAINGKPVDGALRDTVLVPPDTSVTIAFDAANPGTWAFHCHHLYHMNSGMMAAIAYSRAA